MVTMLAAHYIFNVSYASKTFGAIYSMQKYLVEIGDGAKRLSKVLILYSKLVKTNTIQWNILMFTWIKKDITSYWICKCQYHICYIFKWQAFSYPKGYGKIFGLKKN